jgi:aspartate kinase
MKIFKFGGASLRSAAGIRNVGNIIHAHSSGRLLVVVSAIGKTTDMLERIVSLSESSDDYTAALLALKKYHIDIAVDLFPEKNEVFGKINDVFEYLIRQLETSAEADQKYDAIVSQGEILSSIIVHQYLQGAGQHSTWIDARDYIITNNSYREGKVDWAGTSVQIQELTVRLDTGIIVTQGFIGRTSDGYTTTLGREGSDFTAAIFASSLLAESVTIWKDVAGVMNADPRRHPSPVTFEELPFKEAAEMTYYGASVIHPKTIKPLANRNIPLYVRNFDDPSLPGTKIHECIVAALPPLIVWKDNQCLISCQVTDYTFISEHQLHNIFSAFLEFDIRINVMQNSAISFSFCIDFRESKVSKLIARLQQNFEVYYNTGLTLITIKNYDQATSEKFRKMPGVLLEQSSRSTLQVLVRPI